jgi:multidrug efflux pump subunit AcrA (membrane-fusion protein)
MPAATYSNAEHPLMTGLRLRHRRASLPSFAALSIALVAIAGCKKPQDRPQRQAATVSVVEARRATVPYVIEANGIVTPLQSASVLPQVDGIILSVDFQEGQDVRAGQALFHIDPRPYQNTYAQALAVLARDSATFRNAAANADRTRQLLAQKVITPQEGDVNLTAAATAEATLRADLANVEQARFNLENTIVRAPISGKTGSLLVRKGNLVRGGGGTPLVVINQVRPILVRFAIPSAQLPLVLQYGSGGGLPVAAVPGGIAPPTPSIDSIAAEAMAQPADANASSGADPAGGAGGAGGRRGGRNRGNGGASGGASGGTGFASGGSSGGSATDGVGAADDVGGNGAGNGGAARGSRGAGRPAGSAGAAPNAGAAKNANANGGTPVQQGNIVGERMMGKLSFIDNAVDTATGTVQLKAEFDNSSGRLWAGQFATTSLHLFDEQNVLVVPSQAIVTGQRGSYVYVVDHADTARQRAVTVERTAGGLAIVSSGVHDGDRVVTEGQSRLTPDAPVRFRGVNDTAGGGAGRRGKKGGNGGNAGGANGGGANGGGGGGARRGGGSGGA